MKTLEEMAKEAGLSAYAKLCDPPILCFEGTAKALARFRALCFEEAAQICERIKEKEARWTDRWMAEDCACAIREAAKQ